eukprot:356550-Chlamydomonas_euryale.AAC.7
MLRHATLPTLHAMPCHPRAIPCCRKTPCHAPAMRCYAMLLQSPFAPCCFHTVRLHTMPCHTTPCHVM